MRELQQVTTTVPDAAKRCRFYRVELLNGGQVPDEGRNATKSPETGQRWQERQGWESGGARAKQVENIY
jgi:hypothetical protein